MGRRFDHEVVHAGGIEAEGAAGLLQAGAGGVVVAVPERDEQAEDGGDEGQDAGEAEGHG
jgi:hypothetical protein